MNNAVFGKNMENVRTHRHIDLVTTKAKRNHLLSKPNYHITKIFSDNLLAIEMKKQRCSWINLGLSILEISKIVMYNLYGYLKPKYGERGRLYYMGTDNFILYIKTKDIYVDIGKDIETRIGNWSRMELEWTM